MKKYIIICTSLLVLIALFIFLISPIKEIDKKGAPNVTFDSLLTDVIENEYSVKLSQTSLQLNYRFSEQNIDKLVTTHIHTIVDEVSSAEVVFTPKSMLVYTNKNLGFLPTQYVMELEPVILNDRIALQVINSKMGRIPIPSSFLLSNIEKNPTLKVDKGYIILFENVPNALTFEKIEIEDEILTVVINVQITSIVDMMELGAVLLPYGINLLDMLKN
ncbi:MAG: hypothetical protein LPK26_12960 [Bacillaceae bacterium]|nr:hypothetical protein [Bacillaceae bacterium]